MAMHWFRMWVDAIDDEKLRLLAFEDRWHFVAILCLKSSGLLDEPESDLKRQKICIKLGLDSLELETVVKRLVTVGLVSHNLQPVKWAKRQFVSDSSTKRVRKFRERQRNVSVAPSEDRLQKQSTEAEEKKRSVALKRDDGPVERIFDHWRSEFRHPKAGLDPKRRRSIQRSLEAYDEDTLKAAISGYKLSPHHMGQNDQRTVYDDISLFLRDAEHIDRGLSFSRAPPAAAKSAVEIARENLRKQINGSESRVVSEQGRSGESGVGSLVRVLR